MDSADGSVDGFVRSLWRWSAQSSIPVLRVSDVACELPVASCTSSSVPMYFGKLRGDVKVLVRQAHIPVHRPGTLESKSNQHMFAAVLHELNKLAALATIPQVITPLRGIVVILPERIPGGQAEPEAERDPSGPSPLHVQVWCVHDDIPGLYGSMPALAKVQSLPCGSPRRQWVFRWLRWMAECLMALQTRDLAHGSLSFASFTAAERGEPVLVDVGLTQCVCTAGWTALPESPSDREQGTGAADRNRDRDAAASVNSCCLAPEQLIRRKDEMGREGAAPHVWLQSWEADMFALGLLAMSLLTTVDPALLSIHRPAELAEILAACNMPMGSEATPSVPAALIDILVRCVDHDPAVRPRPAEIIRVLDACQEDAWVGEPMAHASTGRECQPATATVPLRHFDAEHAWDVCECSAVDCIALQICIAGALTVLQNPQLYSSGICLLLRGDAAAPPYASDGVRKLARAAAAGHPRALALLAWLHLHGWHGVLGVEPQQSTALFRYAAAVPREPTAIVLLAALPQLSAYRCVLPPSPAQCERAWQALGRTAAAWDVFAHWVWALGARCGAGGARNDAAAVQRLRLQAEEVCAACFRTHLGCLFGRGIER